MENIKFELKVKPLTEYHEAPVKNIGKKDPLSSLMVKNHEVNCNTVGGLKKTKTIKKNNKKDKPKKIREARYRNWAYTDYKEFEEKFYNSKHEWENHPQIKYLIRGLEICPTTNKKHWQGYLQLEMPQTKTWVKNTLFKKRQDIHFDHEYEHSSPYENQQYCKGYHHKKDKPNEIVFEFGICTTQGQNKNLAELNKKIKEGKYDDVKSSPFYIQFHNGIDKQINYFEDKKGYEEFKTAYYSRIKELNEDQKFMKHCIFNLADLQICWVANPNKKGGLGKSELTNHLIIEHGAAFFDNASAADIAYAWKREKICIFDLVRSNEDKMNYGVLEKLAEGRIMNKKYESKAKYSGRIKVVVFTNFEPDLSQQSVRKWLILYYGKKSNKLEYVYDRGITYKPDDDPINNPHIFVKDINKTTIYDPIDSDIEISDID